MAVKLFMPKLGFIMSEGTLVEWQKKPGDHIDKGDVLFTVESDKATMDVEAPGSGLLHIVVSQPGAVVEIGGVVGYLLGPGEVIPDQEATAVSPAAMPQPVAAAAKTAATAAPAAPGEVLASPAARRLAREHGIALADVKGTGPGGRIVEKDVLTCLAAASQPAEAMSLRASPLARNRAAELGLDLVQVKGSGPGGRIVREDVERAAGVGSTAEGAGLATAEPVPQTRIQQIAAERMAASFRTAPHFYLTAQADMSQAVVMREALLPTIDSETHVRLSYSDILLLAVARALREHPALNAGFEGGQLCRYREVNLGLAVDTPQGLTVPVIQGADRLTLPELALRRFQLSEKARANRLSLAEISGGTFTLSNLGMFGIDTFSAILNPPQVAILAIGQIARRPVVVADALTVRPTMHLTLSVDHRAVDGATGARFLQTLLRYLELPYPLIMPASPR